MDAWVQLVLTSVLSVFGASGFWAYMQHKDSTKSASTKLLMGLTYDRLRNLGENYIEREWITNDELEDYINYFYEPYKALGGNGAAERVMREVARLPLRSYNQYAFQVRHPQEEFINNVRVVARPSQVTPPE